MERRSTRRLIERRDREGQQADVLAVPLPSFLPSFLFFLGESVESVLLELSELGAGVSWLARVRYVVYRGEGEG